jgi:bifunctional non-homologous end joining protein LigD
MDRGSHNSDEVRTARVRIEDHDIELTNLDKSMFPESGLTKGDLIDYYRRVAATAIPHYRDRPLSLQRFPDGIGRDGFFQKDRPDHYPEWIDSVSLEKQGGHVDYVLANNAATLVYLANQACITLHLALARADKPHHPDRLVFDLDPSDDDFVKVQRTAKRLKRSLDDLELVSFVQTTGSRGLHVVVPLDRKAEFDRVRHFARVLADSLAARYPGEITTEQRRAKRGEAVFIDTLRNAYGQTAVAPYSVRALENAPVAMPLRWSEVGESGLHPRKYTMGNVFRRLGRLRDPWADIGRYRQSLNDLICA